MNSILIIVFLAIIHICPSYGMTGADVAEGEGAFVAAVMDGAAAAGAGVVYNGNYVVTTASYIDAAKTYTVKVGADTIDLDGAAIIDDNKKIAILKLAKPLTQAAVFPDAAVTLADPIVIGWSTDGTKLVKADVIEDPDATTEGQFCVKLKPAERRQDPALYDATDVGSPLIMATQVIGLADTVAGTAGCYLKASDYKAWIDEKTSGNNPTDGPKPTTKPNTTKKTDSAGSYKFPNSILISVLVAIQVLRYAKYVLLLLV